MDYMGWLAKLLGLDRANLQKVVNSIEDHCWQEVVEKNNTKRVFYVTSPDLKIVQRQILDNILSKVTFPAELNNGVKEKEAFAYVQKERATNNVLRMQFRNYLESIRPEVILQILMKETDLPEDLCRIILILTTKDNKLPVGCSTSSTLANMVAKSTWFESAKSVTEEAGGKLSVYLDDVIISGPTDEIFKVSEQIRKIGKLCNLDATTVKKFYLED